MPQPTSIDVAAGGLLESGDGDNLKIALVYRPRHNDWSLPKGHIDAGETIEEAALREVVEETGCAGEIIEIAQPTSYLVRGRPKIVVFFRMRLVKRGDLEPNDEVSAVQWMTPGESLDRLTYKIERNLVAKTYSP